ncbi:hypothetical protein COV16_00465 [Candidatus Woesearchaeota archaeon CG10_big_fil_rev_8_21_14_0_10_34_8]|nr:MAG: hypothetical protein COV16_00465 [Candidatus Woesearchaeota archaeon CG10_big_fil_rev_8_21_14_0_10_34_8]
MNCCDIFKVFDEKNNLIKEYNHWKLLIRNRNSTLGNCVVIIKRHIENYSDITEEEMKEFTQVVKDTENSLKEAFKYDKINWMMLMMNDKHVHYHVLPRYANKKYFAGLEWEDNAWPSMAKIFTERKDELDQEILNQIKEEIKKHISQ